MNTFSNFFEEKMFQFLIGALIYKLNISLKILFFFLFVLEFDLRGCDAYFN